MRRIAQNASTLFLSFSLVSLLAPFAALAQTSPLTVTPVLFDEQAKVRDILNESFSITNTGDRTLTLFPSVNDVVATSGVQPFSAAQNAVQASASLANWIELSRGAIQLSPGEERTLTFVIRVAPDAPPGQYHASINFTKGDTRDDASKNAPLAAIAVNVEIQADVVNLLQLDTFATDNVVFSGDDVLFKYQVQNIGNQDVDPKGEIRIYDRQGQEVASVDVNSEGKVIEPNQISQLASVWSGASGFGKYKAVINVDYGSSQPASVQDVTYFWIIPWKELLGLTIFTLIGVIVISLYFHRQIEERHFGKLAAAGLIKPEALGASAHVASPREAKIAATIEEKKAWFERFRRRGFGGQKTAAEESAATSAKAPSETAASVPIDLKQSQHVDTPARPPEGHVINLKL